MSTQAQAPRSDDPFTLALLQAAGSSVGVTVRVSSISDARSALARRQAQWPELKSVRVMISPDAPTQELWLIREEHLHPQGGGSSDA